MLLRPTSRPAAVPLLLFRVTLATMRHLEKQYPRKGCPRGQRKSQFGVDSIDANTNVIKGHC